MLKGLSKQQLSCDDTFSVQKGDFPANIVWWDKVH